MVGHPRRGVHFEQILLTGFVHQKIYAPPTLPADQRERLLCQQPHLLFLRRTQPARAQVAGVVAQVFRLVIVELIGRLDLDHRQRLLAQNRHGIFAAADKTFREHQLVMPGGFAIRNRQLAHRFHFADADTRSFVGRFYEQRQTQLLRDRLPVAMFIEQRVIRHWQVRRLPYQLGAPLVHAQRRGHHAAAGIGDAQQFQRALHRAVFAVTPMQRDKHAIKPFLGQRL